MAGRLAGKRAVITGAARGIGKAIAQAFSDEGAELLLADIDADALAATASVLGAEALVIDVSKKSEIERSTTLGSPTPPSSTTSPRRISTGFSRPISSRPCGRPRRPRG